MTKERIDMTMAEKAIFDWNTCSAVRGKFSDVSGYHEFLVKEGDTFRPKIQDEPQTLEEKALFDWKNEPAIQEDFKTVGDYFDFLKAVEDFDRNPGLKSEFRNNRNAYEAFLRAQAKGLVRILGNRVTR